MADAPVPKPEEPEMTFSELHGDNPKKCECLKMDDVTPDNESHFMHRIDFATLKDGEMRSHYERFGQQGKETCKEFCGRRGVSVDKVDGNNEEIIKAKYRTTKRIGPQIFKYCLRFTLIAGGGKIWHDGKNHKDIAKRSHCNLFKSDKFKEKDHIKIVSITRL